MNYGEIAVLIGAVSALCSIIFGFVGYRKGLKTDYYETGEKDSALKSDTEYIKRRVDDVLLEQKETNKSVNALAERVTRVEESAKQAHKRIDRMENKGED